MLEKWARAIEKYEKSPKNWNNPGSIKNKDGGFLIFSTYEEGWNYLLNYLKRAATGKHTAYRPDMTLLQFFEVYAPYSDNNNPQKYAEFVANWIGVSITTKIKKLV